MRIPHRSREPDESGHDEHRPLDEWRSVMACRTRTTSSLCLFTGLVIALGGLTSGAGTAADWSRFRGPNGSAVSDARGLPVKWDDHSGIAWKTPLPGPGSSSPIVVGDRVFVTCYSGYGVNRDRPGQMRDLKRHLVCMSLTDGRVMWDQAVAARQ